MRRDAYWAVRLWLRGLRCLVRPHVPGWSVGRFDSQECVNCRAWTPYGTTKPGWGR